MMRGQFFGREAEEEIRSRKAEVRRSWLFGSSNRGKRETDKEGFHTRQLKYLTMYGRR